MAKDAEMKRGLYDLYSWRLKEKSEFIIRETLYIFPVLSKEYEDTIGR